VLVPRHLRPAAFLHLLLLVLLLLVVVLLLTQ
jgi:hypothetical protein